MVVLIIYLYKIDSDIPVQADRPIFRMQLFHNCMHVLFEDLKDLNPKKGTLSLLLIFRSTTKKL